MAEIFIKLSLADWVNAFFLTVVQQYGNFFHGVSEFVLRWGLLPVEGVLRALSPLIFLALLATITYVSTRKWSTTLLIVGSIYFIGCIGLWTQLMQTVAIMIAGTTLTIAVGIPLGILMARNKVVRTILHPLLDIMQTLPAFVYLIPVLMLLGLGKVPAVFATFIYALPPLVRLTELGIRQVADDMIEAGRAFGCTNWQLLLRIQLPLARPSIMAGINQSVMMALAMVTIASMIGARGLGEDVLEAINNLDLGKGTQAGFAIVILAIVIDRIMQSFGLGRRARQLHAKGCK